MRGFLSFLILLIAASIFETEASDIVWLEKEIDLGIVEEKGGEVPGEFRFINQGKAPVIISDVRTSCGCTKVEYTRNKIQQGDTAVIRFLFSPKGRVGRIKKYLKVYLNNENVPVQLYFDGIVKGDKEYYKMLYPVEKGQLLFETDTIRFGGMEKGMRRHSFAGIFNQGDTPVTPTIINKNSDIEISIVPSEILPLQMSTLSVYINTAQIEKEGINSFPFEIIWGENEDERIKMDVSVIVMPATSGPINR